jgi:PAS domain S-box-containing protein
MIGAPFGELLLQDGDRLVVRAHTRTQPFLAGASLGRDEGLLAWKAVDTRQPAVIADYASWPQRRRIYDPLQLRATADFPVLLRGECIGVLAIARIDLARQFTPEELQQGTLFAQMAALVIDHLRIYEAALSDLAERARAEAALREQEARLAGIIDSAIDAIITVDDEQRIVVFNNAAEDAFHCTEAEALGQSLGTFIPEHARVTHRDPAPRSGAGGAALRRKGETSRLMGRRADGEEFPIEASVSRVEVGGRALSTVMLRDVSDRLRAEAKEAALEAQLRESQKLEAIGTLAGGIAHDFNNIVGAILGNAELMRDELGANHAAQRSLDEILLAGHRARDLIRQILAFSRNEPQQRQVIDLKAVVGDTLAMLRPIIPAGVEFATRLPEPGLFVEGDAAQLQQALVNLCTNAWHALQDGAGRIDIALDTLDIGGAAPPGLGRGRYAHLTVRDYGVGMDAATVGRIFEPFYTTRAPGEGAGLGLSVVHGIVKSHHGRVDVASEPRQGSTFHIYLPAVAPPRDGRPPAAGGEPPPAGRAGHVLYADDDEALVFLVTRMLERQGLSVTGCFRGADALAAIRANPQQFDLLLTDYNMPGMTGIELAREVASLRPDLPVVLTSGYITDEVRAAAVHAGIRHLVYKPNTVDELCDVVQRVMHEARPN